MTIRLRIAFLVLISLLLVLFLYIDRAILTPFILAAIFAYIFNPIVSFLAERLHFPRTLSVIVIYACIVTLAVFGSVTITKRIIQESDQLKRFTEIALISINKEIKTLPEWAQPALSDTVQSLQITKYFTSKSLVNLFPQAVSEIVSFILFAFSAFYFLKEGGNMLHRLLLVVPSQYKIEVEILVRKINLVLGEYLRGQLLLVTLMAAALFILLSILGVQFALILAIFSGFAEIVPYIGPIVATTAAVIVVLVTGVNNFFLSPISAALIVIIIYFVLRQLQDYFVTPFVMGKITKLHPIIILFAVVSAGHLWGVLGLILAVPIAASIRILLEFSLDKIAEQGLQHKQANQNTKE